MDLFTEITKIYPELEGKDFATSKSPILLRDDGDGVQYIEKWEYSKPLPSGLKVGN